VKILGKGIIIRLMNHDDLPSVYSLGKFYITDSSFNAETLAELFTNSDEYSLVLARKNQILGFLISEISGKNLKIRWILVNPSMKGNIYYNELISFIIESHKNFQISVDLDENSIDTINFFKDKGFIKVASTVTMLLK